MYIYVDKYGPSPTVTTIIIYGLQCTNTINTNILIIYSTNNTNNGVMCYDMTCFLFIILAAAYNTVDLWTDGQCSRKNTPSIVSPGE